MAGTPVKDLERRFTITRPMARQPWAIRKIRRAWCWLTHRHHHFHPKCPSCWARLLNS